jgi:predicted phosphodiesterase
MIRIGVITDAHANVAALAAALAALRCAGCARIYHTGDAIDIGSQPAECLDLLLSAPEVVPLMGNHDAWFAEAPPAPGVVGDGELLHQAWTHAQLGATQRAAMARWPYALEVEIESVRLLFQHYGLAAGGREFAAPPGAPDDSAAMDTLFAGERAALICYGHDHQPRDLQGRARYLNPGALGCGAAALARYAVVTCEAGTFSVAHGAAPYDDGPLLRDFEARRVPERDFIRRTFYGGR